MTSPLKRKLCFVDIETFSSVDLKKSNVYRYVEAPDFQILMAAWAIDDEPVQIAVGEEEIYEKIFYPYISNPQEYELVAHNANFERVCFSAMARGVLELEPFEYLPSEPWTDTMALAGEHGYPQKLEFLAKALGADPKDSAGTRLISLFCKPSRSGKQVLPGEKPSEWQDFLAYCVQDVATLRDIYHRLPGWPTETERRMYDADQAVNDAGIPVDAELARIAVEVAEDNGMVQELEIMHLTGVQNPGSGPQMIAWLQSQDVKVANLQAATVTALLARDDLSPAVRRVLELRQELALVAAKKYTAALDRINRDNRLRGSFQFFGAHTGRWAGRGVQLQNLPSATIKPEGDESVEAAISAAILDVKMGNGATAHTLKALVRAMFTGPFTVVDYSAIEARVIAWLAGEEWALQAFRDGRDIYVETAKRMGDGMTRKEGKVATLALGYQGGINSLKAMGAEGEDKVLQFIVSQWREANQNIVGFWNEMGDAFKFGDRPVGDHIFIEKDGSDRLLRLPSGRAIVYHDLKGKWETDQWGRRQMRLSFADPKKPGWRTDTYGGKLSENVTQAVARDVLAEAIIRLQDCGKEVVGHVHDEVLVLGEEPIEDIVKIMVESPTWAEGLPINAEGFTTRMYRKD